MIKNGTVSSLKEAVASLICSAVPEAEVKDAFSAEQYFGELSKALVTVKVQKIRASSGGFEDYIGMYANASGKADEYGRFCEISLEAQILLPIDASEAQGNEIFSAICSALLFQDIYDFEEISCQDMYFDEKAQCLTLQMTCKLSMILAREEQASVINEIKVITKGKEEAE